MIGRRPHYGPVTEWMHCHCLGPKGYRGEGCVFRHLQRLLKTYPWLAYYQATLVLGCSLEEAVNRGSDNVNYQLRTC